MAIAVASPIVSDREWNAHILVQLALERGLRLFCGPHAEYLESEPDRFFPLEIHHPEGATESKID